MVWQKGKHRNLLITRRIVFKHVKWINVWYWSLVVVLKALDLRSLKLCSSFLLDDLLPIGKVLIWTRNLTCILTKLFHINKQGFLLWLMMLYKGILRVNGEVHIGNHTIELLREAFEFMKLAFDYYRLFTCSFADSPSFVQGVAVFSQR